MASRWEDAGIAGKANRLQARLRSGGQLSRRRRRIGLSPPLGLLGQAFGGPTALRLASSSDCKLPLWADERREHHRPIMSARATKQVSGSTIGTDRDRARARRRDPDQHRDGGTPEGAAAGGLGRAHPRQHRREAPCISRALLLPLLEPFDSSRVGDARRRPEVLERRNGMALG